MVRSQPRHFTALLIDRHDERGAGLRLQAGDERLDLSGRLNVAKGVRREINVEEEHATQVAVADVGDD